MKYFAILRDSLREALDSKVLYVLIGLSTLVIAFVATLAFKPLPAQRTMEQFFFTPKTMPIVFALNSHKPEKNKKEGIDASVQAMSQFKLTKVEQTAGETDSPLGTYVLSLTPQVGKANEKSVPDARGLFKEVEELGFVVVEDAKYFEPAEGAAGHIRITLKGTPRTHRIWAATPSLFFGTVPIGDFAAPLGYQLYILTGIVLSIGSWVAVLVGVVITSFFVPNMVRKGTIDLLLVKPIHRWVLLVYKYIGGLMFIFLSTAYALGGIWLVVGLRTGLWANWSMLLVFTITFFFAILYSVSTLVGVVTRSTVTAIMVTLIAWFLFFVVGTAYTVFNNQYTVEEAEAKAKGNDNPAGQEDLGWGHSIWAHAVFAVHGITPRTSDLGALNDLIVFCDLLTGSVSDMPQFDTTKRNWWASVGVSLAWIAIFLGLACLWFTFKDY